MEQKLGFLAALADFSFSEFITTKIIKILYGLGIVFACIVALACLVTGFKIGIASGILMLILSPVIFLLIVIYARVTLEILIVVFRIAENTTEIAKQTRKEPQQS